MGLSNDGRQNELLLYRRWPWHLAFWTGYALFRFWPYYITVNYYPRIFLEYMLLSEGALVMVTYATLAGYRRLIGRGRTFAYFALGASAWIGYLVVRTEFQFYYLRGEPAFRGQSYPDILLNNVAVVLVYFLFISACRYFKDSYIAGRLAAKRREEQLLAEVNNLKSQIAPHFLFNTLNNLYGLAVTKSDKLPDLMLRLSDLLRHALYDTQKPYVPLGDELEVLSGYIRLESLRLEDSLVLRYDNQVPPGARAPIAPLLLIVFVENAFKHAKRASAGAVEIFIQTTLDDDRFTLVVRNNYNPQSTDPGTGIGLVNVRRRLDVLYPGDAHALEVDRQDHWYTVTLTLRLHPTFQPAT
ncbi:sensor histidine kinase [Flaviaesturariibacter amylovorans]|uniref:Signal transduction histidine kinase internal region domain-containing protein n=1 Tax=Flaviaesturariibacter amylovorans TaxID=1084520 RepID=A0ABP8GFH0_9BACT